MIVGVSNLVGRGLLLALGVRVSGGSLSLGWIVKGRLLEGI